FSGIVTMEDLIEQIVGDIDDEYDETELEIRKQDDGSYIVGGNTSLYDLNDELGTEISSDNSETVGGFVIELLGEIPEEKVAVSFENYTFTVMSVKDRRIENVLVTIGEDDNSAENE
ncbi:MAG: transporter associated domain-containing protein, partial [Firmicutes bacterium]|nr:transporter associated domain-containing protein [Bacillota bacterium]